MPRFPKSEAFLLKLQRPVYCCMNHLNILFLLAVLLLLASCRAAITPSHEKTVLFSVAGRETGTDEFEYVYRKNSFASEEAYSAEDVRNYLELFINFKLKVEEARHRGYDTSQSFLAEFESYRNQLARPYLAETKAVERMVSEAYERMQLEIRASHILLRVPESALPADTMEVYLRMNEIRQRALDGESFDDLASRYSEDPSARINLGDLGYFTAFQMVYPFETAAYATSVGRISEIVRTQFGYHILNVTDRIPNRGKVRVAHIMIREQEGEELAARNRIFEVFDQLEGGADWNEICRLYSEDYRTRDEGGELPPFSAGQIDPDFSAAAFQLNIPGEISDPFRTQYGWHIVRLIGVQPLEPFDQIADDLRNRVSRDGRAGMGLKQSLERLKQTTGFAEMESGKALNAGISAPSDLYDEGWSGDTLFLIHNKPYTTGNFVSYCRNKLRDRVEPAGGWDYAALYREFVESSLFETELDLLEADNRDYRMLVNEYFEGLLLFEIMDKQVWSKAAGDSVGLALFFEQHRDRYLWDERALATRFIANSASMIEKVKLHYSPGSEAVLASWTIAGSGLDSFIPADSIERGLQKYEKSRIVIRGDAKQESVEQFYRQLLEKGIDAERLALDQVDTHDENATLLWLSPVPADLKSFLNRDSGSHLDIDSGYFEKGDASLPNHMPWEPGQYDYESDNRYYWIVVHHIVPPEAKDLDSIRGTVISDYQDALEQYWIAELRTRYPVRVYEDVMRQLIKKFETERSIHNPN